MKVRAGRLVDIARAEGVGLSDESAAELIESSWNVHMEAWRRGEVFGSRGAGRWIAERILREKGGDPGGPGSPSSTISAALEDATGQVGTRVVEGAPEVIAALREAGIATALICDTGFTPGRHVRRFLASHGIGLDHYFFSDEVGAPKPHRKIFDAALRATGARPSEAVHIGDLRRTDVAGARAAGMATVRFAGVHDDGWNSIECSGDEADAVIHAWVELPALLGIGS